MVYQTLSRSSFYEYLVAIFLRSLSGGNRRPIPPYKPLPPATTDSILNREKEQSDKNSNKHKIDSKPPESSTEEATTKKEEIDRSEATTHDSIENATKRYEENNGQKVKTDSNTAEKPINSTKGPESEHPPKKENASAMESEKTNFTKHDDSPKSVIPLEIPTIKPTKTSKIGNSEGSSSSSNEKLNKPNISKTSTKSYSTLSIETSSSIQIIESTTTTKSTLVVQSSVVAQSTPTSQTDSSDVTSSTIGLQPSKSAEFESTVSNIPTENLPSTFAKISASVEKSTAHIPASNTFSKNSGRKSARMKFCSFCKIILHSIHNEFVRSANKYARLISFVDVETGNLSCTINFLCSPYRSLCLPTPAWNRP